MGFKLRSRVNALQLNEFDTKSAAKNRTQSAVIHLILMEDCYCRLSA